MKQNLFVKGSVCALALLLAACGSHTEQQQPEHSAASAPVQTASDASSVNPPAEALADDGHNAENSLDWSGVYQGTFPCGDCEKNLVTLQLNDDKTYVLTNDSQGVKESFKTVEKGRFTWENGSIVQLDDHAGKARFFVAEGLVQMLADGQNGFDEKSPYKLNKQQ